MPRIPAFPPTPRLRSHPLTPDDFDLIRRIHTNPTTMATLLGVRTEEKSRWWMGWNLEHWADYGFGICPWFDRESGELVGIGGLRRLELDGVVDVEVGYALLPEHWGKGYATEIARAAVAYGFDELQLPSIVALTMVSNTASRHVMEKAGLSWDRDLVHADLPHVLYRIVAPLAEWREAGSRTPPP